MVKRYFESSDKLKTRKRLSIVQLESQTTKHNTLKTRPHIQTMLVAPSFLLSTTTAGLSDMKNAPQLKMEEERE